MQFHRPLLQGKLIKRYKRFFADIEFNGETVLAHVPNSGSMRGCSDPGSLCYFSFDDNPNRKLKYTLEMVQAPQSWVGVNTSIPNKIVKEAFYKKTLPHWSRYDRIQGEAYINEKSRIDFALWNSTEESQEKLEFKKINLKNSKIKFHFIEVKNVSLVEAGVAYFPDAVTERGQKHLKDLMNLIQWGHSCEILFTIQRQDGTFFSPASHIDPLYAKLLKDAYSEGVLISPYLVKMNETEIFLTNQKVELRF